MQNLDILRNINIFNLAKQNIDNYMGNVLQNPRKREKMAKINKIVVIKTKLIKLDLQ